jgi:hypothetical protein
MAHAVADSSDSPRLAGWPVSKARTAAIPEVEVANVEQRCSDLRRMDWNVDGHVNADLKSQVTGYLLSGSTRKVPSSAAALSDRPPIVSGSARSAKGQLAQARAQLVNAEANEQKSRLDVENLRSSREAAGRNAAGSGQRRSDEPRKQGIG